MYRSSLLDTVSSCADARRDLVAGRFRKRREDLRTALDLWRLPSSGHFRGEGCASIGEFGERLGFSASEARMLARAGHGVSLYPPLRTLVLRGRVTLEAASILERVLADPLVRGPDSLRTWVYRAKTESARRLRNRVEGRLRELQAGAAVHETTLHLTDRGRDDLERSCVLLGDRARRSVSESEAVEVMADYFLDREDPRRRTPGTRRVGDTRVHRGRAVPAEVGRAVLSRAGGRCEAPYCDTTHGLERAHILAHRDGGGREAGDLVVLCHGHHVGLDAGWIGVAMVEGRPVFHFRGDGAQDPPRGGRPVPPHLRPNPLADRASRWTWSRPPPR